MKMEMLQNLWDEAKIILRDVYSNSDLPQETRKVSHKLTLK